MKRTENNNKRQHRSTFAVLFYIKRQSIKKDGCCGIMCRISIDGDIAPFSVKDAEIQPDLWDAKAGRAIGKSKQSLAVNKVLERTEAEIRTHYDTILYKEGYVTADLIRNEIKGFNKKATMLLQLFQEHNEEYALRVDKDRAKGSYECYVRYRKNLAAFIHEKYGLDDYEISRLRLTFMEEYEFYLRFTKGLMDKTIAEHLISLKKIVVRAINQGTLRGYPFLAYNIRQPSLKFRHLEAGDVEKLMALPIANERLCYVRDIFIFSTFTGLAYADLCNLTQAHIHSGEDGNLWIRIKRQKTGTECIIPLMEIPQQILARYKNDIELDGEHLFRQWSRDELCRQFRKLEKLSGIKHITFHMARHNFATHIALANGVPIETIALMMGHSSVEVTQIYADVTDKKLAEDMKAHAERTKGRYTMFSDALALEGNNDKCSTTKKAV
jgi:integrase